MGLEKNYNCSFLRNRNACMFSLLQKLRMLPASYFTFYLGTELSIGHVSFHKLICSFMLYILENRMKEEKKGSD